MLLAGLSPVPVIGTPTRCATTTAKPIANGAILFTALLSVAVANITKTNTKVKIISVSNPAGTVIPCAKE